MAVIIAIGVILALCRGIIMEDEDITDKSIFEVISMIKTNDTIYKIVISLIVGVIVISLMLASHNIGYGKGYKYVLDFKQDYIDRYCTCYNNTIDSINRPIEEWNIEGWESMED